MSYVHQHVSERPDPAGVVECTWATGVELARAALAGSPKQPPATAAEREALRASGGGSDSAGSNYNQLAMGLGARYGLYVVPTLTLPATEIPEGTFLGVQGLYSHLPYRLQWPARAFAAKGSLSSHSAVVFKLGGRLLWCDPNVSWNSAWHGEAITWAEVVAFHTPLLLEAKVIAVHLPPDTATEVSDMAINTRGLTLASSHAITLPANTPIYESPGPSPVLGRAAGEVPYFGSVGSWKAVRVNFGQGSLIGYTDSAATPFAVPVVAAAPLVPDVKHVVTVTTAFDGVNVNSFTKAV